MTAPLVLIDFSGILHATWHLSGSEPDPNWTSIQAVAKVRALASGQPYVAICTDGPKSRATRQALDATYKAQRDAAPEALYHQMRLAIETLKDDGFPIWQAEGHEADDVIASATIAALTPTRAANERDVLIVTADKDLCQLVSPRVTIKHAVKGDVLDADAVKAKFGVQPSQMGDYLALVGDASDNIKGAKGIGPKRAVDLLTKYGTLTEILTPAVADAQTPAVKESLYEFAVRADVVRQLIALRTDVPVNIEEAFAERVPKERAEMSDDLKSDIAADIDATMQPLLTDNVAMGHLRVPTKMDERLFAETHPPTSKAEPPAMTPARAPETSVGRTGDEPAVSSALVPQVMLAPAPAAWEMQLEPRSFGDAWTLAKAMFASRLFSAYGTAEAVLSTILAGRELGLQSMASLRAFHIIEGRPTLSAGIIQAMVLKSPHCRYFRCTERTNERATFVTKRNDDPEVSLTFTIDDAKMAWSKGEDAFKKSGYGKNPADMFVARASTKLARLVYADVVNNLYAPEEFA